MARLDKEIGEKKRGKITNDDKGDFDFTVLLLNTLLYSGIDSYPKNGRKRYKC